MDEINLFARGDAAGDPVRLTVRQNGGSTVGVDTTTTYSANAWHTACGVVAASNDHRVFLDGGGKNTSTTSAFPTGFNQTVLGGRDTGKSAAYHSGRVEWAGVWNRALSDAEWFAFREEYLRGFPNLLWWGPRRVYGFVAAGGGGGTGVTVVKLAGHPARLAGSGGLAG